MENIKRDFSIDELRCVGLLAIFAAHTFSSELILQLVCFDVTLLMMLGGASFAITQKLKPVNKWGGVF